MKACGTPLSVCSSDETFASCASLRNSMLLWGGTVVSARPWCRIVGGRFFTYVVGVAAFQSASDAPGGIGNPVR